MRKLQSLGETLWHASTTVCNATCRNSSQTSGSLLSVVHMRWFSFNENANKEKDDDDDDASPATREHQSERMNRHQPQVKDQHDQGRQQEERDHRIEQYAKETIKDLLPGHIESILGTKYCDITVKDGRTWLWKWIEDTLVQIWVCVYDKGSGLSEMLFGSVTCDAFGSVICDAFGSITCDAFGSVTCDAFGGIICDAFGGIICDAFGGAVWRCKSCL